jgi:hypothetical protein
VTTTAPRNPVFHAGDGVSVFQDAERAEEQELVVDEEEREGEDAGHRVDVVDLRAEAQTERQRVGEGA